MSIQEMRTASPFTAEAHLVWDLQQWGPWYTRADAITDGALVEVSPRLARAFGFTYPLALSGNAWRDVVKWDQANTTSKAIQVYETEPDRLAAVLAAAQAATVSLSPSVPVPFSVCRMPGQGTATTHHPVTLTITLDTGDHGEFILTIAHPDPTVTR